MKASFRSRLATLERASSSNDPLVDARLADQRARHENLEAAWQFMYPTMSTEHAELFVETYRSSLDNGRGWLNAQSAGYFVSMCLKTLAGLYCRIDMPSSSIRPEVSFAMPPAVAEVYLSPEKYSGFALPLHDCEDCGFKVPNVSHPGEPHGLFTRCPLCGGRTGWYAYVLNRGGRA